MQRSLRACILPRLTDPLPPEPIVAGADISYNKGSDELFAAVILLRLPDFEVVEESTVVSRSKFPYIPGLLSFREAPPLMKAFDNLKTRADAVMIDGQGMAHPRRFGIAAHIGWMLDLPTIGCAKSILVGKHGPLGSKRGSVSPLVDREEIVGCALRTRDRVKPVYVSVGNRIDLESAVDLTLRCVTRYRIPEPTRQAHLLVNRLRTAA